MANSRPRGPGVAMWPAIGAINWLSTTRSIIATLSSYLECQPHILPLVPALASHREESPQRHRKIPREFANPQVIKPLVFSSLRTSQVAMGGSQSNPLLTSESNP